MWFIHTRDGFYPNQSTAWPLRTAHFFRTLPRFAGVSMTLEGNGSVGCSNCFNCNPL